MTADWADTSPAQLLEAHLQRPRNTARSYAGDLETFREFLGLTDSVETVQWFIELGKGAAERTMHNYLAWLRDRYDGLNTIRRKVSSVRGLAGLAHRFGVIPWAMDRQALPAPLPLIDIRGPQRQTVEAMVEISQQRGDAKGRRDAAAISLMAWSALRCNEVLTLDVKHLDIDAREVELLAKGLWGRTRFPIPICTTEAIQEWLEFRGYEDGPLFTTLGRGCPPARLTYWGMYYTIRQVSEAVGQSCSPHRLRHFAATEHLRLTNGNVPWAMALTRHRDPRTLMIYNDERTTRAREAMELIAAGVPHYRIG